jgi:hypothetical protein
MHRLVLKLPDALQWADAFLLRYQTNYAAATEWSPINGGDDGARDFLHSAYRHTPSQPPMAYVNKP